MILLGFTPKLKRPADQDPHCFNSAFKNINIMLIAEILQANWIKENGGGV